VLQWQLRSARVIANPLCLFRMNRVDAIRDIESAFASVALEDGIGILEAETIESSVGDHGKDHKRQMDFRRLSQ
jgi:hypothetical protein